MRSNALNETNQYRNSIRSSRLIQGSPDRLEGLKVESMLQATSERSGVQTSGRPFRQSPECQDLHYLKEMHIVAGKYFLVMACRHVYVYKQALASILALQM